jgi:AAA+ ATPase superfamily predicted ATPase
MFYIYLYRMKEEKLHNPFLVAGYYSPAYFCDRETETEKIISALSNNRNVSLISPRRFGKTGLIHHVFYHLKAQKNEVYCFYIDIFSTQNLSDFVQLLAKTILGKQVQSGLQEIFAYLQQSGKRCYIAIDEFQQITEYPEKGVEALLRSYIQFSDQVKFIFAGSKKHLMDAMFSSVNRPFYQSTQKIGLREIPLATYSLFAENLFAQHGKHLDSSVFKTVYNMVLGHTWYIQFILNQLFSLLQIDYSESDVNKIVSDVLLEENATYKTYCELLTKGQLRLLTAIAKERKVNAPFQTSFLQKHHLTAASSVKLALKSLIDKTLILKDDEGNYFVYDRFFALWLEESFR